MISCSICNLEAEMFCPCETLYFCQLHLDGHLITNQDHLPEQVLQSSNFSNSSGSNQKITDWVKKIRNLKKQIKTETRNILKVIKTESSSLISLLNKQISYLLELKTKNPDENMIFSSELKINFLDSINIMTNIKYFYSATSCSVIPQFSDLSQSKIEKYRTIEIEKIELIYTENLKNSILEKWKLIKYDRKAQVLKILKKPDEDSLKRIQDEVVLIKKLEETGIFCRIIEHVDDNTFGYYHESITTLDTLLGNKSFSIEEIAKYLNFILKFMSFVPGKLLNTSIEPSIIGYENQEFKMIDFKYGLSNVSQKYLPPEFLKDSKIKQVSSFMYTSGLIVLEMLGEDITGFNNESFFALLNFKIDSLQISDEFKYLLKKMLEPNINDRLGRSKLSEFLNLPNFI